MSQGYTGGRQTKFRPMKVRVHYGKEPVRYGPKPKVYPATDWTTEETP